MEDHNLKSFFGLDNQEENIGKIQKLENTRLLMKLLCQLIASDPMDFSLKETTDLMMKFISDKSVYLERFLYSELSMQLFGFDDDRKANFFINLDILLENFTAVIDETTEDEEIKSIEKMIIKIYDHTYLVENQIGMVNRSVQGGTESIRRNNEKKLASIRDDNQKELKNVQKEYIAILSIFSAVVLAFSGGLTFSASVLENVAEVSMYRLVFIALLIGFVLLNLFFGLFHYIRDILEIKSNNMPVIILNIVFIVFMGLTFILWNCGAIEDRDEKILSQYSQQASESVNVDFNVAKN